MSVATITEALASDRASVSFEFFPPKDDAGETALWQTITELDDISPSFVSVTYGAGGSDRNRTTALTARIAHDTEILPLGHLTCVGQTRAELVEVIEQYHQGGVHNILALRGDPQAGAGERWESQPGGLNHALDLIELIKDLHPEISVGVAAFPTGHPESPSLEFDSRVIADKVAAGAEFAITQFFYRLNEYTELVDRVRAKGADIPIVPGIMPIESLRQVQRMAQLSGTEVPQEIVERVSAGGEDREIVRKIGIDIAAELGQELLDAGAPGLHFYTLNKSRATREVFAQLRLNR